MESASGRLPPCEIGLYQAVGEMHWQDLDMASDHGCGTTRAPRGVCWSVASLVHQGTSRVSVSGRWSRRTMEGVEDLGKPA